MQRVSEAIVAGRRAGAGAGAGAVLRTGINVRAAACIAVLACASVALAQSSAPAPVPPDPARAPTQTPSCKGTVYLTIDTGSMSQVQLIADTLGKHQVKATFFLANEKTINGDYSLDDTWAPLWKRLVADGHKFGSHTFDHVYFRGGDVAGAAVRAKPQFGAQAGRSQTWNQQQFCSELDRVKTRFTQLTGSSLAPLWRAPGGFTTPNTLRWAKACGYAHTGWSPAGFLGDELPSHSHPNQQLLARASKHIKHGDVLMMHTGIWSRKDAFAPMLDPLIIALKAKQLCFATVGDGGY